MYVSEFLHDLVEGHGFLSQEHKDLAFYLLRVFQRASPEVAAAAHYVYAALIRDFWSKDIVFPSASRHLVNNIDDAFPRKALRVI